MRHIPARVFGLSVVLAFAASAHADPLGVHVAMTTPPVPMRIEAAHGSGIQSAGIDVYGVTMIHRTVPHGRVWFSKWSQPRLLTHGETDPYDAEFQNRGEGTFSIDGSGAALATGTVTRHYLWDQTRQKKWQNVELTFYAMRVKEDHPPSYAGFAVEMRTDDGHVDDPKRQCAGASYAMAMYYDGRAEVKKEIKHPVYTAHNPSAMIWPGNGEFPRNVWIGFKAIVRDVPSGVALDLYRDLTDGTSGGQWKRVLSYVDQGHWSAGDGSPVCGNPADRILRGAFPIVLVRTDNATVRYKKMSLREIAPE